MSRPSASAAGAGIGDDLNDMEMTSYNNNNNNNNNNGGERRSLASRLSQSANRGSYQQPDAARRSTTHHGDDDDDDYNHHDDGDDDDGYGTHNNNNNNSSFRRNQPQRSSRQSNSSYGNAVRGSSNRVSFRNNNNNNSNSNNNNNNYHNNNNNNNNNSNNNNNNHNDDDDDGDNDLPERPPASASPPVVALPGEKIKWAKITIDDALQRLEATRDGLTQAQFEQRFSRFGPNKLSEVHHNPLLMFLSFMWNPLSWAMECAAILAIGLYDFPDFALILALLLLNACIGYFEEKSAGDAVAALMGQLAPQCKVKRDGEWKNLPAADLVPGDIIRIRLGDVVPADVKLLEGDAVKIDQSSLTGESLPVNKPAGSEAYSGSIVKQGEIEAVVHSTGINTFFGQAANLISQTESVGHLQIVLTTVGNFCLLSILLWVIIELGVQFGYRDNPCTTPPSGVDGGYCPTLSNLLVLIVGGIPVAMPTVLSVTMALGATQLAKKDAIVTRLTAIEELAGMDILCSDKTGTLTLNELSVDVDSLLSTHGHSKEDILIDAALAARIENNEAIDICCHESAVEEIRRKRGIDGSRASATESSQLIWKDLELIHYAPFDPVSKRTVATIRGKDGKVFRTCKGAPQVILGMDEKKDEISELILKAINDFANRGFRTLGVARSADGEVPLDQAKWEMVGLIPLFDPPRIDSGRTIERAKAMGVSVKMVTGDQLAIAKETARQLGIPDDIHTTAFFNQTLPAGMSIDELVERADGFAEVFPEHKYDIVKRLQDRKHIVGMTGDGVNDAPALKKSDIGIAVADATDAARSAADIVLLSPGLSVIIDALIGSRKIFQRMKNYSIYSIAMTIRIVFTFGLLTTVYDWYFPTLIIVILAILNDGTVMTISKDRVKPSETPDSWNLKEIFIVSAVIGLWLTVSTVILFHITYRSDFFVQRFGLSSFQQVSVTGGCGGLLPYEIDAYRSVLDASSGIFVYTNTYRFDADSIQTDISDPSSYTNANPLFFVTSLSSGNGVNSTSDYFPGTHYLLANVPNICNSVETCQQFAACGLGVMHDEMIRGLIYIQVSITGQATIFVTRAKKFSWRERPAYILMFAFAFAQLIATLIGVYGFSGYPDARDGFRGCGWGYALVAWVWSLIFFIPLDILKLMTKYFLTHRVSTLYSRIAFFTHINAGHPTGRHLGRPKNTRPADSSAIDNTL